MAHISTIIVFGPPYFWTAAFYPKTKQICQGPMIDLPKYQTSGQWVPNRWRKKGKRAKVENFLYILRSSGPRRVQRHQCYTTCWGRIAAVKRLPCHISQFAPTFHRGQKSAPLWCRFGPRHISATIWAKRLKFYTHLDRAKYCFRVWQLFR